MNRKTLAELAAGYALGNLDPDEQLQLDTLLAHDPSARLEVAALIDTAAAIATAGAPPVTPSGAQRARILATVKATSQQEPPVGQAPLSPGYTVLADSCEGWVESGAPGFRSKLLSKGPHPGHQVYLIALEPGAKVAEHDHSVIEEMYIISGHLETEGRVLGPGDFMRGEAGTHHHECGSPDGCVALLILSPALAA
jgi:putative transcriptional regulator